MSKDIVKPDWAMSKRERDTAARVAQGLPPKKRRLWLWLVAILVVAAGAGGYLVQSGKLAEFQAERVATQLAAEQAAAEEAARPVLLQIAPFEVAMVTPAALRETLKITGSLAPARQVHLSAEVSGRVLTVAARAGDAVSEGDTLVEFDTETLASQFDQVIANAEATRVQLAQARTDFERTESLVDRGLAATTNLERARSTLDQLTASLTAQETLVENAKRALERATVTAPFDGVVSDRSIDPGQFVGAGTPLMTLVDLTSLEVAATAPVTFSPRLAPGQPVDLHVEGLGTRRFPGQVDRLSPVAIVGSRMLPVYVSLSNEGGELRGGMFATGRIVLEEKLDGIGVPAGALRADGDGAFVVTIEDGLATRRGVEVTRDWQGGALVEIASGLAAGDVVIIEPLPALKPGMQVELVE